MSSSRAQWWQPWRRWPRSALAAEIVLVGLIGAWLGLLAGGRQDAAIGPVQTRMSVVPSIHGGSVVAVPPLGRLTIDTHDGPWQLDAEVTRINAGDARRIFNDPSSLNGLPEQVTHDVRAAAIKLVVRSTIAAVLGALLLGLMVFRRQLRRVLLTGAVALGVVLAGGGVAAATWDPKAIEEPRYDGLLAIAPTVVGDARSIVTDFQKYEQQLAKIVTNVSRLYDVTSTLPAYTPDPSTIRVLHVSDIHLNPSSWEVIRSIAKQFNIGLIIDTGDLTDHGSSTEDRFATPIANLGVPYVFIRGNHDSVGTERAVASQKNAIVLNDKVVEVGGLRLLGAPDPRFTPDKDTRGQKPAPTVLEVGDRLAAIVRVHPADVVLVHDPAAAAPLDGTTPLVLAGHLHHRKVETLPRGTLLFDQGSTGGAGLRGLEGEKPTPIECSVLYFDRQTRALQAWDDITLGGLGLASAEIERHVYKKPEPRSPSTSPSPATSP